MELKKKISLKKKEQLKKDISNLGYNEHCEIYNIIRRDTDKISENSNGIFINLKFIKDETLSRVEDFVHYCKYAKTSSMHTTGDTDLLNNVPSSTNTEQSIKNDSSQYEKKIERRLLSNENLLEGFHDFEHSVFKNAKLNLVQLMQDGGEKSNGSTILTSRHSKKSCVLEKSKKPKFNGVRERIMKKCRNINKDVFFCDTRMCVRDAEDDLSQLELISTRSIDTISSNI